MSASSYRGRSAETACSITVERSTGILHQPELPCFDTGQIQEFVNRACQLLAPKGGGGENFLLPRRQILGAFSE